MVWFLLLKIVIGSDKSCVIPLQEVGAYPPPKKNLVEMFYVRKVWRKFTCKLYASGLYFLRKALPKCRANYS